jgi:hypothetical protein
MLYKSIMYKPPSGPSEMWFVAHSNPSSDEYVVSIDFDKALATLPEQDFSIAPEFHYLLMPRPCDLLTNYQRPPPVAPPPSPVLKPTASSENSHCVSRHYPTRCSSPDAKRISGDSRKLHNSDTDKRILDLVDEHGPKWRSISRQLGGRENGWSDDVVRNRYIRICAQLGVQARSNEMLRKSSYVPRAPSIRWTSEEDESIREQVLKYEQSGRRPAWVSIARKLGSARTAHSTRNRAARIEAVCVIHS